MTRSRIPCMLSSRVIGRSSQNGSLGRVVTLGKIDQMALFFHGHKCQHYYDSVHTSVHDIPQLLISTILLGGIYALIAVGLTLIFGIMRVVNFAHGEFLMLGMYLAFWAFTLIAMDPSLVLLPAIPLFFLAGLAAHP